MELTNAQKELIEYIKQANETEVASTMAYMVYRKMGVPYSFVEYISDKFKKKINKHNKEIPAISYQDNITYDILKLFAEGYYEADFTNVFGNMHNFVKVFIQDKKENIKAMLRMSYKTYLQNGYNDRKAKKEAKRAVIDFIFYTFYESWKQRTEKENKKLMKSLYTSIQNLSKHLKSKGEKNDTNQ